MLLDGSFFLHFAKLYFTQEFVQIISKELFSAGVKLFFPDFEFSYDLIRFPQRNFRRLKILLQLFYAFVFIDFA